MMGAVRRMSMNMLRLFIGALAAGMLAGCAHWSQTEQRAAEQPPHNAVLALEKLKQKYAPDNHLGIYNVGFQYQGHALVLTGEVDNAEARIETLRALESVGVKATERVQLLPATELGDKVWGISSLSVASAREQPEHKAEMGTQILMGDIVRIWKRKSNPWLAWYYVQSADGYLAWLEQGTFVLCTRERAEAWRSAPLLMITAFEDRILESPEADAQPVSDVVMGDLVKLTGEQGDWFKVELPDARAGFLPKKSAEDYRAWKQARRATPDNIERTARRLLGRPYLWGGNSPKGLDCSGFTKLVFGMNGIDLNRNASHQARQGRDLPPDLRQLKKGDLLFFGPRARVNRPERVTHVGIYLGGSLFIHSSERVQINSMDPSSPIRDEFRIRSLLHARRVLPDN
jgi:gamma-D-glutamyl-L-lysine dipeptidyl-peptidase